MLLIYLFIYLLSIIIISLKIIIDFKSKQGIIKEWNYSIQRSSVMINTTKISGIKLYWSMSIYFETPDLNYRKYISSVNKDYFWKNI